MTIARLRERFPHAPEHMLRAMAADFVQREGPAPTPRPAKAKGRTKTPRRSRVPLTRNGGRWTEARYWQAVRSAFRRGFRFWQPAVDALNAARIPAKGPRGRKWLYVCAGCRKLFLRRQVEIDHVNPCGALTSLEHLADFLTRLTPEDPKAYQVRCLKCHGIKTTAERAAKRVTP